MLYESKDGPQAVQVSKIIMTSQNPHHVSQHILITGATGFVGRHLSKVLVEKGAKVTALARRPDQDLPKEVKVHLIESLTAPTNWQETLKDIDTVIHLAAITQSSKHPTTTEKEELHKVNCEATLHLANAAAAAGVKRFIFLSSVKVLGEKSEAPLSETSPPAPEDDYARSKWAAEQGIKETVKGPMQWVIIRPPLLYGPRVSGNFNKLIRLVTSGLPLPFRQVNNKRSLCSLENLADFITLCTHHPAAANQTFLVADKESPSTPDLMRLIGQASGRPVRLWSVPPSVLKILGHISGQKALIGRLLDNLEVSCHKAQEQLKWEAKQSTANGIEGLIKQSQSPSP